MRFSCSVSTSEEVDLPHSRRVSQAVMPFMSFIAPHVDDIVGFAHIREGAYFLFTQPEGSEGEALDPWLVTVFTSKPSFITVSNMGGWAVVDMEDVPFNTVKDYKAVGKSACIYIHAQGT